MPSRIGILGGSFDPIHNGHLRIAEATQQRYSLDKVVLVPAYCPPHKARPILAPFEHRLAMLKLAVEDFPHFDVSDIERHGQCPSYAGDTVRRLKEVYGAHGTFYFIVGLDNLLTITDREKAHTYPGLCFFIATTRPGFSRAAIEKELPGDFLPSVIIHEMQAIAVSSTDIKHRIRAGASIDGMVPPQVKDYIHRFKIYTSCFT